MRFASVADVKNHLSAYLAKAKKDRKPIVVTHHGKPYALIQPISEGGLEALGWERLAERRLQEAWGGRTMPSTTTYRRGQVVVVNVPYSDRSGVKPRPALVICPISSQPRFYRRPGPGDCPLRNWPSVGLRYPSTVRVSKILAVDNQIARRSMGSISGPDLARVVATVRLALDLS
jgi:prevent-host-death family protein